jgi:hypothetical protein
MGTLSGSFFDASRRFHRPFIFVWVACAGLPHDRGAISSAIRRNRTAAQDVWEMPGATDRSNARLIAPYDGQPGEWLRCAFHVHITRSDG